MVRILETDVVIVGGGMAGAYAAIEASRQGVDVLLLTKGLLAKSGCSPMAAFLTIPPYYTPSDSEWKLFEDAVAGGASGIAGGSYIYLADQEALRETIAKGSEIIADLESMGVYFRRDEEGKFVLLGSGFDDKGKILKPRFSLAWNFGLTGKSIMDALKAEMIRRNIAYREEVRVTKVLMSNGAAAGVTALDYVHGEFFAVRAKAIIIATGSGVYLWRYTTASRECTGDGHMMALRAGAELIDIEFVTWHFADVAWPEAWRRLQMYPQPFPGGFYPHWYDSKGRRFMKNFEIGSKEVQAFEVSREVLKGNLQKRGGYYCNWKHVDEGDLKEWFQNYYHLKKLGLELSRGDMIECGMTAHSWHGGIRANARTETCVPGLFAAGGVAPNHYPRLHTALWGGKVSGICASAYAKQTRLPDLSLDEMHEEGTRVNSFLRDEPKDGYSPTQVKRIIADIFFEKMWYIKIEADMTRALEELYHVRMDYLPRMRVLSKTRGYNYEWVDALDAADMLDLGELLIKSSLMRKESRGPFIREDYPETNDRDWLKNIVIRLSDGKAEFRTEPVKLVYVRPS